jgi:hypothetical protein
MINPMSVEERRAYYLKSLEVIESDEEIKEYEEGLNFKKNLLTVISINTNVFRVLLHPIRFCRAEKELRRLEDIKVEFNALKKEQLPTLFVEESGDLREDFRNATFTFKPDAIKDFMKKNPIFDEEKDKKLVKIR